MTEDDAKAWLTDHLHVSRETMAMLDAFRAMVIAEAAHQNLISAASIDQFWARHIVDSAQLLSLLPIDRPRSWLDLGTGAGFPGIVIAILADAPITFVESRRKRVDFLAEAVEQLGLSHVTLAGSRLELVPSAPFGVITARAFAPLPKLLDLAHRFSVNETIWVLPKGKSAREELESLGQSWQGVFHVKQSVTDPEAAIIVGSGVARKKQGK